MAADAAHAPDHQPKAKIFISYSRKDIAFADRLEAALKARGFEPLIDRQDPIALQDWSKGIAPFEDWWKRIQTLITKADTIVFVLSPDAISSKVALDEIRYAASLNKRVAPVVCREVEISSVPDELRRLNFVFLDGLDQFDTGVDRLATALQIDLDWIRRHSDYGEAARRWAAAGRPGLHGLLLRSPMLEEAERWIALRSQSAPEPTEETVAFLSESRRTATWEGRRKRRVRALVTGLAAVVVVGLAVWIEWDDIDAFVEWHTSTRPFMEAQVLPYVLRPADEQALLPRQYFRECAPKGEFTDYCPNMVVVPAGSFLMGSPTSENGHKDWEGPQHWVSIPRSFAVSTSPVNFSQWETCANYSGCGHSFMFSGTNIVGERPVNYVAWSDAVGYSRWLSQMTGKTYRLLTEAEYEYAARGGTQTAYPWGDDIRRDNVAMANCDGCGSKWDNRETAPERSFAPNGFGLYDMVGNIWEWVQDCDHENYDGAPIDGAAWRSAPHCSEHITRGGSFLDPPENVRSAARVQQPVISAQENLGFRVMRVLQP